MKRLLLVDIKNMRRTKLFAGFALLFLLLPVALVFLCGGLSALGKTNMKENHQSLIAQYESKIPKMLGELEHYRDNAVTTNRINKIIRYYEEQKDAHTDMLRALEEGDKGLYRDASIRAAESELSALTAGFHHGASRAELRSTVQRNAYLRDNHIEPLLTVLDVNFVNLLLLFIRYIAPVLLPVATMLLSTAFSGEYKNHTMKITCQQPFSRRKIYLSKYLSANTGAAAWLAAFLLLLLLLSGAVGGLGSFLYPAAEIGAAGGETAFLSAGVFFLRAAPLFLAGAAFLSSVGMLLSLLVQNSAVCGVLAAAVAFAPVAVGSPYTDVSAILLSGAYPVYLIALPAAAALLLAVGCWAFERKDIFT